MYRVSIEGIDYSGKTSVVKRLEDIDGVKPIHLASNYNSSDSIVARISGKLVHGFSQFTEYHKREILTGFAYLLHLIPHYFDERVINSNNIIVTDRHPIIDTLVHSEIYLYRSNSKEIRSISHSFWQHIFTRSRVQSSLEHFFDYPNLVVYLEISPEAAIKRSEEQSQRKQRQLQDDSLTMSRDLLEQEISRVENEKGVEIVRINNNPPKTLEEVTEEVLRVIEQKSGITLV